MAFLLAIEEGRETMKQRDIKSLISGGTILIAVALYMIFADPKDSKDSQDGQEVQTEQKQETNSQTTVREKEIAITPDYAEKATGKKLVEVKYLHANDGDTINVEWNGEKRRVRLLMIDTPEMNYDKGEPMPYAEDAKNFTQSLMKNAKKVELLFDKGPQEDDYERLLAYVYVDGKMLQESLLEEGLAAMRYINKPNNTLEKELRDVQKKAEQAKRNIWSIDGYFENNRFQNVDSK